MTEERWVSGTPEETSCSLLSLQTCIRFHSLKEQCKLPTTGATYIMSMKGGRDNSPEGLQVCRTVDIPMGNFAGLV